MDDGPADIVGRVGPDFAGGHDSDAVRAIWHAHRRWVAAILIAHMPRGAELEDLLQEVAMKLVRHVGSLQDPAAIRPWLRTIAINAARTSGRRQKVRKRFFPRLVAENEPVEAPTPEAPVQAGVMEEGKRAMEMARSLPEEYREPLLLRAVRGMSYRQIADTLGVPITTIETRLVRARRMLREQMEQAEKPVKESAR